MLPYKQYQIVWLNAVEISPSLVGHYCPILFSDGALLCEATPPLISNSIVYSTFSRMNQCTSTSTLFYMVFPIQI